MNKNRLIIPVLMGIAILGIVLMYKPYALFSIHEISKSAITIKVGTMNGTIKVDGVGETTLSVPAGNSKTFTVTLENLNNESGKFLFYYIGSLSTGVKFGYLEDFNDIPPDSEGIVLTSNEKKTYSLYVENNTNIDVSIHLGVLGGLSNQKLELPSDGHDIEKIELIKDGRNPNIIKIFTYAQSPTNPYFCVTGEESTCEEKKEAPSSYYSGTIIKYRVNDSEEKYFHVLSETSTTLTLQQRENTVSNIAWYTVDNNTKGPTVILSALEEATKGWTNVLDQVYTLSYSTGCDFSSCTQTQYNLGSRRSKARLITLEEVKKVGCKITDQSGPIWMYNYLRRSTNYGGTMNSFSDNGYWTSSASTDSTNAWFIYDYGKTTTHNTSYKYGARAVITINKKANNT